MKNKLIQLTGKRRAVGSNLLLGMLLAFIAGAINAGGFFLVGNYTSHMTGIISTSADEIAIGEYFNAAKMIIYMIFFIFGAAFTALITLFAKKYKLNSQYCLPLILEAILILLFSILWIKSNIKIEYYISILCFLMGLQNALITKISSAIIRTTHISGMATDLGIEIGRFIFFKGNYTKDFNLNNAKRHIKIIFCFFLGGVIGAFGVKLFDVNLFFCLSGLLFFVSAPNLIKDFMIFVNFKKRINPL